MAVAPVLVVSLTFNPPTVSFIGPVHEHTVLRLGEILPGLCTISAQGRKPQPRFHFVDGPVPYWTVEYKNLICDELAILRFQCAVLDTLELEGHWRMKDTQAIKTVDCEAYKFFFVKKR